MLENKKSEDEELNNGYQSNGNQQDYFAYDDSNLQTYEAPPNLDMPKNNESNHTYGNYPSYYSMDELPDDEYSTGSTKKQQTEKNSSSEKSRSSAISFDRGSKQSTATPVQGTDQTGTQQQAPSNQKNISVKFRIDSPDKSLRDKDRGIDTRSSDVGN